MSAALAPVATAASLLPGDSRSAPQIVLGGVISAIARDLGMHLASENIYSQGREVVTVCPDSGDVRGMEPIRFCSWVEEHVSFVQAGKDGLRAVSISAEMAAKILAADNFLVALRPLQAVVLVRLPVWGNEAQTAVRLLPAGYDPATATFTVDTVPYPDDVPIDEAWDFFNDVYKGFPFAEEGEVQHRRSMGVQMAAHFALYCRNLLKEGVHRPMFCWLGNQPELGKSTLAMMITAPVFGRPSTKPFPAKEEEQEKKLFAAVKAGKLYISFDNAKGTLNSEPLEQFLTASVLGGRVLGTSTEDEYPNLATVFLTGNGLKLSTDLARRTCVIDLFYPGDPKKRAFSKEIEGGWILHTETRKKFLACLWACVRFWAERGCPRTEGRKLSSFEGFSKIIGGIVMNAGYADPMAPPVLSLDEAGAAWERLLVALADTVTVPDGGSVRFTVADCLEKAEELEVFDIITGGARDPKRTFGTRLKQYLGREWIDGRCRRFVFGPRCRANTGSSYPITILGPAPKD